MNDEHHSDEEIGLEDFDKLFVGDISEVEKNLQALLPRAEALEDQSIYLQILSQIALAQAVQKKFDAAHKTLDLAEKQLSPEHHLARVRILLERGRVFFQEGNAEAARPLFKQSFELSSEHQFDSHAVNAAHMVPFVAKTVEEKIEWNERAIKLAENSESVRAQEWLGSLYNNVGQAYLEAKQYDKALLSLRQALEYREQEGNAPNIRVAKWAVARTLRLLNRSDEALPMLLALLDEYDSMVKRDQLDMPAEMLPSTRGLVYEELAEIDDTKTKMYAGLAYDDLSKDEWFRKLEPDRLERLKQLRGIRNLARLMTNVAEMKGHVGLHRKRGGPFVGQVAGLAFEQNPAVFSPEIAFNVEAYVEAFPYREGESLWEVGCGVGALAVVAALRHDNRVVATDINPTAVDLTRQNAIRHGVSDRIDCRLGSLFDPLLPDEQFDTIYWNWPFSYMPVGYRPDGLLERAFCDPGYQLLDAFLSGVDRHLKPDGRLILTFGTLGNRELFVERTKEHGYSLHSLFETTMHNGRTYWLYALTS